jgi:hypothetical protein
MSKELARTVCEIATGYIGVREMTKNRGPEIDGWLLRVGLDPTRGAYPWCAAFAWCMLDDACKKLEIQTPIRSSARVVTMWQRSPSRLVSLMPRAGSLFFHATDPKDLESTGHCGIVTGVAGDHFVSVEGNTNDEGSREGDQVARKIRRFAYANLGYVDLERV